MIDYEAEFLDLRRTTKHRIAFSDDKGIHHARKEAWEALRVFLESRIAGSGVRAEPGYYSLMYVKELIVQHEVTREQVQEQVEALAAERGDQPDEISIPVLCVTKRLRFEAAHVLGGPGWKHSKCSRPHGHSYVIDVTVKGPMNPATMAVMDFTELGTLLKDVIHKRLDHQSVNDSLQYVDATAEAIAVWAWDALTHLLPIGVLLMGIRLQETDDSWVTYLGE